MIQRISEIEGEPIVGRYYLVPCVTIYTPGIRNGLWPVLLPAHNDLALNFTHWHYHYDFRFMSERHYQSLIREKGDAAEAYSVVHVSYATSRESPMLCKRLPVDFPAHRSNGRINSVVKRMEQLYGNAKLSPCLRCPHKGISLKGQPIKDGMVICPAHGLRFNVKTGEMVSRLSDI